jgi:hypothetical protein
VGEADEQGSLSIDHGHEGRVWARGWGWGWQAGATNRGRGVARTAALVGRARPTDKAGRGRRA